MSKKIVIFGLLAPIICGGIVIWAVNVRAEELSSQQLEQIKGSCITIKATLKQIHSSDALLRVNTGQIYESISTKLMERFDERADYNNMDEDALVASANNFDLLLDNFRSDYVTYEQQLSLAINIDCTTQPAAFYDAVAQARTNREKMHSDVAALNQALDQYNQVVAQFEIDNQKRIEELSQ